MPRWVYQLKCYDGTDPDSYREKIDENMCNLTQNMTLFEVDPAIDILRKVASNSVNLSPSEHFENKELCVKANWLLVEKEGHKKRLELQSVLFRAFGYYFKKKEIKALRKYFMRPRLGFDVVKFFRYFADILDLEENRNGSCNNITEMTNSQWVETNDRISYVAQCDKYLKDCEEKVRSSTLKCLQSVLLERANSRFKNNIDSLMGNFDRCVFKR